MAGIMDDMQANINNADDSLRARYEELKQKDADGDLDDRGRAELDRLRDRFEGMTH